MTDGYAAEQVIAKALDGTFTTWPKPPGSTAWRRYGERPVTLRTKPAKAPKVPPPPEEPMEVASAEPERNSGPPWREDVARAVCEVMTVRLDDLRGPRRDTRIMPARMVCYWGCRAWCPRSSIPKIGAYLGGRDHSTVHSGLRKVEANWAEFQPMIDAVAAALRRKGFVL